MKTGTPVALWKVLPAGLFSLIAMLPQSVWAANSSTDTSIGTTLCTAAQWMTGNVGVGLAVCGVAILGIVALLGRVSWGLALLAGSGISIIFGAGAIVVALGGGACTSATGNSGTGPTGPTGPPPSTFLNLGSTGNLSSTSHGLYNSSIFNTGGPYMGGRLLNGVQVLNGNTMLNGPLDGWVQVVFTNLPPGTTINPLYTYQGSGVDSDGNAYLMQGFYNISGSNAHPLWTAAPAYFYQNGQPQTYTTTSGFPPGVTVEYKLYSSFSDYSAGCVTNCALTDQHNITYNTSTGTGIPATPCTGTPTSGNCVAPPL